MHHPIIEQMKRLRCDHRFASLKTVRSHLWKIEILKESRNSRPALLNENAPPPATLGANCRDKTVASHVDGVRRPERSQVKLPRNAQ